MVMTQTMMAMRMRASIGRRSPGGKGMGCGVAGRSGALAGGCIEASRAG